MIFGGAFLLLVPLRTFTFGGRYGILEDFGPSPAIYLDMKLLFLINLPLILMTIMSVVFNAMTLRNIIMRRKKGPDGDKKIGSNAHMNKYLFVAVTSSAFMLFGTIWCLYALFKFYLLRMGDHENFPYVFVPLSEIMKTINQKVFWTRFISDLDPDGLTMQRGHVLTIPACGIYFFVCFGLGKEARQMHRDNFQRIVRLLGWGRQNSEALESFDLGQSHSCQRWRLLAIFRRIFPPRHNQKVSVAPFDIPSYSPSPSLEKGVLNICLHAPNKARAPGQINTSPPPSLSMYNPSHPSLSQSSNTSNEELAQPHNAISSRKRRPPHLPTYSTNDGMQTGLESLSYPPNKPPLPPSARPVGSIDNTKQGHPQFVALLAPPPAYFPKTSRGPVDMVQKFSVSRF